MLFALASLAAAATAPLAPSGKWTVDYRKDMCVVSRPFGAGATAATFAIQPGWVMTSSAAKLFVFLPATSDTAIHRGTATVTLQPSGIVEKVQYTSWIPTGATVRSYYVQINAAIGEALKMTSALDFKMGDMAISLQTGQLQSVLSAMRDCNSDLFKSWGFTDAGPVEPAGNPSEWIYDDFPWGAKDMRPSLTMVLNVAPIGKATACRVVVSSGSPTFDARVCTTTMARGRYKPFTGTGTRPMVLTVAWER